MKKLMTGNEAVARGAYEAGVRVAAAYPGTPSTEITESISVYDEIYSEWSTNEKVALEVAIGASFGGVRALCSMKHVGLNVAADPLFTCSYTGVNAGLVIVVADDPGMHSSQNEQDSRNYAKASKVPMLEPSDSRECLEYTKIAFDISERFDTPVLLRMTTRVSHSQSIVETGERILSNDRGFVNDFNKYVMMPAMGRKRHIIVEERLRELSKYSESTEINSIIDNKKDVGIITGGISFQYCAEALGDSVSYLKIGMIHPLPIQKIIDFSKTVKKIYVVEELDPFMEEAIAAAGVKNIIGKEIFPLFGELSASLIRKNVIGGKEASRPEPGVDIPVRPPVLCPGCPHRGVFYVLNRLKLNVLGDIGCYTLGALPPLECMDTCICMGAGVGMIHGAEKARGREFSKRSVAVIGDSTFVHSGITGLIDIIYNKGSSTIIILDNSITGMTGHQDNPTTGRTIKGEETSSLDLAALCTAIGVKNVRVCDPYLTKEFEKIIKEEINKDEASVVIAKRPCALLKSSVADRPYHVIKEKCRYCRICLKIGCPSIVDLGDEVGINSTLCVGCGLCASLCPYSAITQEDK
jgi:indolepyruvate ferredoxin oxidoreductase, alpha subunit